MSSIAVSTGPPIDGGGLAATHQPRSVLSRAVRSQAT